MQLKKTKNANNKRETKLKTLKDKQTKEVSLLNKEYNKQINEMKDK